MKTTTLLFGIVLMAQIIVAQTQCEAVMTLTTTQNTVALSGSYFENGIEITNPAMVEYLWTIGNITLTGQALTYTFTENGVYTVCLTASGPDCTATTCDSIFIGNDVNPCNLSLTYDITHCSNLGIADGAIDITVTGGTPPYTYFWSNQEITEDISGLLPGVYTVVIDDNANCSMSWSFSVGNNNNTDTTTNPTDTIFNDLYINIYYNFETNLDCSATVFAQAVGGTPPYTYMWNDQSNTATITNACGGDFFCVTVTDSEYQTTEACIYVDFYNGVQDTTWNTNDTLGAIINDCFENIVYAEIISYVIEGDYITVVWAFIDDLDEITYLTVTYTLNNIISEGIYILNLYVNCTGYKSLSVYSDQILVTSEDITGINGIESRTEILAYPNPACDILNIEWLSKTNEEIEISIFNISGQIVFNKILDMNNGVNNIRIDVSEYSGGMYFIRFAGESISETIRFTK